MKSIKLLSLACLTVGITTSALAEINLAEPVNKGRFNVGIDALYLRANSDSLNYAIDRRFHNVNDYVAEYPPFFAKNQVINSTYHGGLLAQIGYSFPCSTYDLNLSYLYFKNSDTNSVNMPQSIIRDRYSSILIPPLSGYGMAYKGFSAAYGKAEFDLRSIDLDMGKRFSDNNCDVRFLAGLRYANVDRDLYQFGEPLNPDSNSLDHIVGSQQTTSKFQGMGPRVGIQGRYNWCRWGIDADLNASVLAGQLNTRYQSTAAGISRRTRTQVTSSWYGKENKNTAVPVLEAKLGVDYTYPMSCRRGSSVTFEAGYRATSYFNVLNTQYINSDYSYESLQISPSSNNLILAGPYLGVKYCA